VTDQTVDNTVQIEFCEVVSSVDNSYVTSETVISPDMFGNAKLSTTHNVHREHSTWIRNLRTGLEENHRFSGVSNSCPGHILAIAKFDGELVSEHNMTTGETSAVKTLTSYIANPIIGGFTFSIVNLILAPFMLAYVTFISLFFWKRSRLGNLYLAKQVTPWPELIKFERILALIQIVALSAVTYVWFIDDFHIGYQRIEALKATFWALLLLWPISGFFIFASTISRRQFDKSIGIKLRKAAKEISAKG
jgi:hypothetical protein